MSAGACCFQPKAFPRAVPALLPGSSWAFPRAVPALLPGSGWAFPRAVPALLPGSSWYPFAQNSSCPALPPTCLSSLSLSSLCSYPDISVTFSSTNPAAGTLQAVASFLPAASLVGSRNCLISPSIFLSVPFLPAIWRLSSYSSLSVTGLSARAQQAEPQTPGLFWNERFVRPVCSLRRGREHPVNHPLFVKAKASWDLSSLASVKSLERTLEMV